MSRLSQSPPNLHSNLKSYIFSQAHSSNEEYRWTVLALKAYLTKSRGTKQPCLNSSPFLASLWNHVFQWFGQKHNVSLDGNHHHLWGDDSFPHERFCFNYTSKSWTSLSLGGALLLSAYQQVDSFLSVFLCRSGEHPFLAIGRPTQVLPCWNRSQWLTGEFTQRCSGKKQTCLHTVTQFCLYILLYTVCVYAKSHICYVY